MGSEYYQRMKRHSCLSQVLACSIAAISRFRKNHCPGPFLCLHDIKDTRATNSCRLASPRNFGQGWPSHSRVHERIHQGERRCFYGKAGCSFQLSQVPRPNDESHHPYLPTIDSSASAVPLACNRAAPTFSLKKEDGSSQPPT